MSKNFYRELPAITSFEKVANLTYYQDLPEDWWVIIADVMGSTKAIVEGRYKQVNTVGASTIASILNCDRTIELPFVFGGDGATFAVPPELIPKAQAALLGAQKLSREEFGLELRVGMVAAAELRSQNLWLKVCRYSVSKNLHLASFAGRGWEVAESWIKDASGAQGRINRHLVREDAGIAPAADFTGVECRWQGIPSGVGNKKISMVIQSMERDPEAGAKLYQEIISHIHDNFGHLRNIHPVAVSHLKMSLNPIYLWGEVKVKAFGRPWREKIRQLCSIFFWTTVGILLMRFKVKTEETYWGEYKKSVQENTDYRKFDGSLKMIVEGSDLEIARLDRYLKQLNDQGRIVYGTHTSSSAIMTCLVFSYSTNHVHFLDGGDGGYALAARAMKLQLKSLVGKRAA